MTAKQHILAEFHEDARQRRMTWGRVKGVYILLTDTRRGMSACETCKHWRFDKPDWEYDELRFGECKRIIMRESLEAEAVDVSGLERWSDEADAVRKQALSNAKAFCVDGSSYYAALRTAPDFGCVLHEQKDPS